MYFIYVKGLMTNSLALPHVEVNLCRLEGAVNLNLGIQIMSTLIFLFFVFVKWASMLFVACSTKLSKNKQTNKQQSKEKWRNWTRRSTAPFKNWDFGWLMQKAEY